MAITNGQKEKYFLEICLELATSSKGLQTICDEGKAKDINFPCRKTVFVWMNKDAKLFKYYESAKELQVEALVDEIIDIADDKSSDYMINEKGQKVLDRESVQRSSIKIDTRKWIVGKLKRRKYGDDKDAKIAELENQLQSALVNINGKSSNS